MAEFPVLKTGAVAQYPSQRTIAYATTVLRFVDATEQRYREFAAPERTWVIRLSLLDDAEMTAVDEFLRAQRGELHDFAFTDPWDSTVYGSCRLIGGDSSLEYVGERRGQAALMVRENRAS